MRGKWDYVWEAGFESYASLHTKAVLQHCKHTFLCEVQNAANCTLFCHVLANGYMIQIPLRAPGRNLDSAHAQKRDTIRASR